jgi:NAD(P)-dependent dehydrogenase (short-subunit alcohol dehydrogenase family)
MRDLAGRVAVVTGAGSGIGRALAGALTAEGMRLVITDIERAALAETEALLRAEGATVLPVCADVASYSDVDAVARATIDRFGAVHLLCNNAGVTGRFAPLWEQDGAEWEWLLGVNLRGVINGIRAFVPRMLAQGGDCHIVNTASEASFTVRPYVGPYHATKHAVLAVSETLALELHMAGAAIGVSVLCPGGVNTRVLDAARNRPGAPSSEQRAAAGYAAALERQYRRGLAAAMPPAQVAEAVVAAVKQQQFYIFTHPVLKDRILARARDTVAGLTPLLDAAFEQRLRAADLTPNSLEGLRGPLLPRAGSDAERGVSLQK